MHQANLSNQRRTIGFHPCVGKKASGQERPTTVVIRTADGKHQMFEFGEQQLLDFFTCGAMLEWRDATMADVGVTRPPHHHLWAESDRKSFDAYEASDPDARDVEREKLFRVIPNKKDPDKPSYRRLQVPAATIVIDPQTDTVGVANGGLGYQIMDVLLGRFPEMDLRVIGSGTLKESRPELDRLLPKTIQRQAEKVRLAAEKPTKDASDGTTEGEDDESEDLSASAAKDANAKFDAHRIAYALADDAAAKLFHRCTLRDRDWAGANIAYGHLETARKARVATEQQFRQIHRTELRRLAKEPRVTWVTIEMPGDDEQSQSIEDLLEAYIGTLRMCLYTTKVIEKKTEVLKGAYARIEGARLVEEQMEQGLELALRALPEYTDFLASLKSKVDQATNLPMGKYIGERIFGRWIAGFGSPMSSRLGQPMRASDVERIAACRTALTDAVSKISRDGLPTQPDSGNGKTREWLLACERITTERLATAEGELRLVLVEQLAELTTAKNAYSALVNAKKCASNRPLNRVIAFMGLHVKSGGKYADVALAHQFPRRRKGGRANWNERLLRQGAYQWGTLIIKGGDSFWKHHVYLPYKERLIAEGMPKGHAHKRAFWRMLTVAVRWVVNEWFSWERRRANAETTSSKAA